jgi:hypothetical protein
MMEIEKKLNYKYVIDEELRRGEKAVRSRCFICPSFYEYVWGPKLDI